MPRSMSNSQIDQLGVRLRSRDPVLEADFVLLQRLRAEYDEPMGAVERTLRDDLAIKATSRLKTTNTIVDKLRRQTTRLSKMQDIAGLRIVRGMALAVQDELVTTIADRFPGSQVIDRRLRPSYGYRAVHLVVEMDDLPVEIQVRSDTQDAWAQGFEKLSDQIGRGIRYGDPPERPGQIHGALTRAETVIEWLALSADSADWEQWFNELAFAQGELGVLGDAPVPADLAARLETARSRLDDVLGRTRARVERMSGLRLEDGDE